LASRFDGLTDTAMRSLVPQRTVRLASVVAFFSPSLRAWRLSSLTTTLPRRPDSHAEPIRSPRFTNVPSFVRGSLPSLAAVAVGSGGSGSTPGPGGGLPLGPGPGLPGPGPGSSPTLTVPTIPLQLELPGSHVECSEQMNVHAPAFRNV
jgi:hypothetical protein